MVVAAVTHKEYSMPDDPLYIHMMAGSALMDDVPERYVRDDTGDNISSSNRRYCELTALYWLWKNCDADIIGICHYRRYFAADAAAAHTSHRFTQIQPASVIRQLFSQKDRKILDLDSAEALMADNEVILPSARNYVIETNYSQYAHAHHHEDLDTARIIINEKYPEYIPAYDRRMRMTAGHRFNMFIMKRDILDRYCTWLFDIISELEKRLDISGYSERDSRVFGYVAERLLDVWLDKNCIRYTEVPYVMTENEHIGIKAACLALRKLKACLKTGL